MIEVADYLKLD